MGALILTFLAGAWKYIAIGLGSVFLYLKAHNDGKNAVINQQQKEALNADKKALDTAREVNSMSDSAVNDELQQYFRRKD